jgi:hypothetical protein
MERAVFHRRDVQASETETATGYDDTNHESRAGTKRLHVFKAASERHRQGVTIGVFILFVRKAPQHGAEAGF